MRNLIFIFIMLGGLIPITISRPFVGVIVWCWISFMNPHELTWGISMDMPWALMIFISTIIGCFAAKEPKSFPINATTVLLIVFVALITMTSAFALAPSDMVEYKWSWVAKSFIAQLLIISLLINRRRIHALIWIMVISLGYFGLRGGVFTILNGGKYHVLGPPSTMVTDNNHLAAALLVALPLMNYLRMQSKHKIIKISLIVMMSLTLFSILGSYSRGAFIGLAAMSVLLWFNSYHKVAFAVVVGVAILGAVSFMPQSWVDRMSTINSEHVDDSAQGRLNIWHASWEIALARPFTGGGFLAPYRQDIVNEYDYGTTARAVHSIYFEVLGEHGFPTFFVWLGITLAGLVNTWRIIKASKMVKELKWAYDLAKMAQVSIVAYLVAGTFLSLCYWDFYFTLIVAIAATWEIIKRSSGKSLEHNSQSLIARKVPAIHRSLGIAMLE